MSHDAPPALRAFVSKTTRPFAEDVPEGLIASPNPAKDYRIAVRAYIDGRFDDAERAAMPVALSDGALRVEALLILARVAEATKAGPKARRMYARAFHFGSSCAKGCAPRPRAPVSDLFSYAAAWPGFRSWPPSCIWRWESPGSPEMRLTPDASVLIVAPPLIDKSDSLRGPDVTLLAIPSRVFIDRVPLGASDAQHTMPMMCFSDAARFVATRSSGAVADDNVLAVGPLGGPFRTAALPALFDSVLFKTLVDPVDGTVFLADESRTSSGSSSIAWYRADPSDRALRRIPFRNEAIADARLPDGSFVGFEGSYSTSMSLFRFDARSGKRLGMIAKAEPIGSPNLPFLLSPDQKRLVYATDDKLVAIDLAGHKAVQHALGGGGPPFGLVGAARALLGERNIYGIDLSTGALAWADLLDDFDNVTKSGHKLVARVLGDVLSFDLEQGTVVRYPVPPTAIYFDFHCRGACGDRVAALSADGKWLVASHTGESRTGRSGYAIYDVHVPSHPVEVLRSSDSLDAATFVGESGVARLVVAGRGVVDYDASKRAESPGLSAAPQGRSGNCEVIATAPMVRACPDGTSIVLVLGEDKAHKVVLTFPFGATGGMAVDEAGYFELFGEVPAWFRASATCGGQHPLEMCGDRYEREGLVRKFVRGDLSYREPS